MTYPAYLSTLDVKRRLRAESSERLLHLSRYAVCARLRAFAAHSLRWRDA